MTPELHVATTPQSQKVSARQTSPELHALLKGSMRELFQTETSAVKHRRREAKRNPNTPPARVLEEVSRQAERFLQELPSIAEAHELPKSAGGSGIGALLSLTRDKITDRLIRMERSYRVTLIGVRHGVDLVVLVSVAAQEAGLVELRTFCERWLEARRPLVDRLEIELEWFAKNPESAMRFAR